jgi:hypothetical protein
MMNGEPCMEQQETYTVDKNLIPTACADLQSVHGTAGNGHGG